MELKSQEGCSTAFRDSCTGTKHAGRKGLGCDQDLTNCAELGKFYILLPIVIFESLYCNPIIIILRESTWG